MKVYEKFLGKYSIEKKDEVQFLKNHYFIALTNFQKNTLTSSFVHNVASNFRGEFSTSHCAFFHETWIPNYIERIQQNNKRPWVAIRSPNVFSQLPNVLCILHPKLKYRFLNNAGDIVLITLRLWQIEYN